MLKKIPIEELIEDYRLYPRKEVDGATVEEFREALQAGAKFPPIRVCRTSLRIIDGFHRKTAYEREHATHVLCSLEDVADEIDLFRRAVAANARHGRRYSVNDQLHAIRLAKRLGLSRQQISFDLSLPPERVEKLERMWSGGKGQMHLERNIPSRGGKSKRVEKAMDTISQIVHATSLLRCLTDRLVDDKSEELREALEALLRELQQYLATHPRPSAQIVEQPRVTTPTILISSESESRLQRAS